MLKALSHDTSFNGDLLAQILSTTQMTTDLESVFHSLCMLCDLAHLKTPFDQENVEVVRIALELLVSKMLVTGATIR
jgi:hypothetical protein